VKGFGTAALSAFSLPGPRRPRTPARHRPVAAFARLAGIEAILDPSGALWWPAQDTLVVSDLHLETGSSYARTGQMLPPYDTGATLARLAEAVRRTAPRRLVALGDSFHDPFGPERLTPRDRLTLAGLAAAVEIVWITGNHDHAAAAVLGGVATPEFTLNGVVFRHIPTPGPVDAPEVAGHLHPAARIEVRGRRIRRRAFVGCGRRLVMPAFGCLTGGLDVADAAFAALWPEAPPSLHLIGRDRVYSV
jgi:DNA ligase-associated metallophosphoesterase